jgi:hypothetical protein
VISFCSCHFGNALFHIIGNEIEAGNFHINATMPGDTSFRALYKSIINNKVTKFVC